MWPPDDQITEARIREAWRLRSRGLSQYAIADRLGMSQPGVSRLLSRTRRAEAERYAEESEAYKADQTAALEHILEEAIAAWHNSKTPRKRAAVKRGPGDGDGPGDEVQTTEVVERDGDPSYLAEARATLKDLRSLWGLDVLAAANEHQATIAAMATDLWGRGAAYEEQRAAEGGPGDPPRPDGADPGGTPQVPDRPGPVQPDDPLPGTLLAETDRNL